jgi:hypothetical protein
MAELGTTMIHPATGARPGSCCVGRVRPGIDFDTEDDWTDLYRAAGLERLQTTTGPSAMMTPTGFLRDEGALGTAASSAR